MYRDLNLALPPTPQDAHYAVNPLAFTPKTPSRSF